MNEIVALIGVLIGTSGLASMLSGVASLHRTRRLQGKLRVLHDSSELVEPIGQVALALEAAKSLTALDLAASVLMKSRVLGRITFGVTVLALMGGYFIWVGIGGFSPFLLPSSSYQDAPLVALGTTVLAVAEIFWLVRIYVASDSHARELLIRKLRSTPEAIGHLSVLDRVRPDIFPEPDAPDARLDVPMQPRE